MTTPGWRSSSGSAPGRTLAWVLQYIDTYSWRRRAGQRRAVGVAPILVVVKLLLLLSRVLGAQVVVEVLALHHTVAKVLGNGEGRAGGVPWAAPPPE
jgi:hypothetical protein